MRAFLASLWILLASLLLISCGGGGSDGVFTNRPLALQVSADQRTLPVNTAQQRVSPTSPYVTQVAIRVNPAVAASITVDFAGPRVGGLISEEEFFAGTVGGGADAGGAILGTRPSITLTANSGGVANVYFVAGIVAGDANLRIRANYADASGSYTAATASTTISVRSDAGPTAGLAFTGPFIEALRVNRTQFQLAQGESFDAQNGTYSRVISVTVTDANGNPAPVNTPVYFKMIDSPLTGYPEQGFGRFSITGDNGNPLEGGFSFSAPSGDFANRGARIGDRLVLLPSPDGRSFYHQGIRTIVQLPPGQPNTLMINLEDQPFRVGEDQGATVPYVIGRARVGSIQPLAFTNADGVATTLLTYPYSSLGRTAILVAHTEDYSVSTVFYPNGPVFLGDGTGEITITASLNSLPSNVTDGRVTVCVSDTNSVPVPAFPLSFGHGETGGARIDVNGLGASGTLLTGAGGCVEAIVNVSGQVPGQDAITLNFGTAEVQVLAVDSGNLGGNLNCVAGTLTLTYLTNNGSPIPGALVFIPNHEWASGAPNFSFTPASAAGASAGVTNDSGAVTLRFTLGPAPGEYNATIQTGAGDSYDMTCVRGAEEAPVVPRATMTTSSRVSDLTVDDVVRLSVTLAPAPTSAVDVRLLVTGTNTNRFTLRNLNNQPLTGNTVRLNAGQSTQEFLVTINPGTVQGNLNLQLTDGAGYIVAGDTSNVIILTTVAPPAP